MNITVTVNNFSKVEFFDYVFDTFVEADYAIDDEAYERYSAQLNVLYGILRSCGWMAEYQQWVADGAGVKEAAEALRKALPVA
ncbi:MAG: hypothetical protein J6W04_05605 [Bacteroidales bacterium]|nr:hypothetical protein [Bacteroidales bacterium]